MKEEFLNLYTSKISEFRKITETFPDADLAGPLLMSPNSLYSEQKNKLLIIGQETNGWTYFQDSVEKQMKEYEKFNVGVEYYASPFWNITRKVEKALSNDFYSCSWTNINKYDLDCGRPHGEYEKVISSLDYLILDELKIIQPKVCLFFTGPSFDERIKSIFNGVEFCKVRNWSIRQFCQLKHPMLPDRTFRSYHPKSLRIRYLEDNFIEFITGISNNRTNDF